MPPSTSIYPRPTRTPIVIAHRAGALLAAENSREAFDRCAELGFTHVETDAHVSADGQVVLIHDPVLDRVAEAKGVVSSYTVEQLETIRLRGSQFPPLLLDDALRRYPSTYFNIDAKEDAVVEPLLAVIAAHDAWKRVCIASFSPSRMRRTRRLAPQVTTSLSQGEIAALWLRANTGIGLAPVIAPTDRIVAAQVPMRHAGVTVVTPRFIAAAHRRGLAVHVWTPNTEDEIREALSVGADGVITDDPVLARAIIESNEF